MSLTYTHCDLFSELQHHRAKLAVLGMGYVGLPLALAFARHFSVVGFDVDAQRLEKLNAGIDPSHELGGEAFEGVDITFTGSLDALREASFFVVAVPTPIDAYNAPDLSALLAATRSVALSLKPGDAVCYESTVFPGCTEEECLPLLEEISGLRVDRDFLLGYSPERINPGDQLHRLDNTVKVVSGHTPQALDLVARVYGTVVLAGVHRTSSIRVAEASKIVENTQRDVNIALMNELSILFSRLDINTFDVIEAAGTKWNFLKFYPGLVGGHCIGVDPYYLVHKASQVRYHPKMISAGRFVNDSMGGYIGKKVVKRMIELGKTILGGRVLLMGLTFKENVADIRNSKAIDIVHELQDYGLHVEVVDAYAAADEVRAMYGLTLLEAPNGRYDAVVVTVSHRPYCDLDEEYFKHITRENALLVDVRGIYKGRIHELNYWSL